MANVLTPENLTAPEISTAELVARNQRAAAMLAQWIHEPDDNDQSVWPILESELKSERIQLNTADDSTGT